jgi:hypothetical protein
MGSIPFVTFLKFIGDISMSRALLEDMLYEARTSAQGEEVSLEYAYICFIRDYKEDLTKEEWDSLDKEMIRTNLVHYIEPRDNMCLVLKNMSVDNALQYLSRIQ